MVISHPLSTLASKCSTSTGNENKEQAGDKQDERGERQHEAAHTDVHRAGPMVGTIGWVWLECPMGFLGIPGKEERMPGVGIEQE